MEAGTLATETKTRETFEKVPIDVEVRQAWRCRIINENFGNVTADGLSLRQGIRNDIVGWPLNTLPDHIQQNLRPGLTFYWHQSLIIYSDGTREVAESFRIDKEA